MESELVAALEQLLGEAPGAEGLYLEPWEPEADEEPATASEEGFAQLADVFAAAVAEVAATWGAPAYRGTADDPGFPSWSDALLLALWQRRGNTAFIALRHDDPSQPMFLELGAMTPDEIETARLARG